MSESGTKAAYALFLLLLGLAIIGSYLYFYFSYRSYTNPNAEQGPQGPRGAPGQEGYALSEGPTGPIGPAGSPQRIVTYKILPGSANTPYSLFYWNRGDNIPDGINNISIFAAKLPLFLNQNYVTAVTLQHNGSIKKYILWNII